MMSVRISAMQLAPPGNDCAHTRTAGPGPIRTGIAGGPSGRTAAIARDARCAARAVAQLVSGVDVGVGVGVGATVGVGVLSVMFGGAGAIVAPLPPPHEIQIT